MAMTTTQLALFPPLPGAKTNTGFVYYATDGNNVKIGYTTSPRRRGGELKLTMLWTFPGTVDDERRHHRLWARHRIIGSEWFRSDPAVLEWLDERVLHGTVARATLRMLMMAVARRR